MYKCEFCGQSVRPGTPCKMVVVERRMHDHPFRSKVHKLYRIIEGHRKKVFVDDPGGRGYQIVREAKACAYCANKYSASPSLGS